MILQYDMLNLLNCEPLLIIDLSIQYLKNATFPPNTLSVMFE